MEEEHGNSVKISPVLKDFLDFFQISLAFNIYPSLVLVEVKLKVKTDIFIFP